LTDKLSSGRKALAAELEKIASEWNNLSAIVKNCFRLKELANKHLSDRNFYASKGEKEKENLHLAEQRYNQTGEQFITEVNSLEQQTFKSYQEWAERMAVSHFTFLKDTTDTIGPTLAQDFPSLKGLVNIEVPIGLAKKPSQRQDTRVDIDEKNSDTLPSYPDKTIGHPTHQIHRPTSPFQTLRQPPTSCKINTITIITSKTKRSTTPSEAISP